MPKKTIEDIDLTDKRVLIRVDFNVPQDENGNITNTQRMVSALPTIKMALDKGAKSVVLMSHLGRPDGQKKAKFTLKPVADKLSELLDKPVTFLDDCVGEEVEKACADPAKGSVILLENMRFHAEEEGKGKDADGNKIKPTEAEVTAFRESLAKLGDVYVCDAFGTAHRAHSSMVGLQGKMPCVSGLLVAKELEYLDGAVSNGEKPMAAIVGGSKVSTKITVLEALLDKCDKIIIGGGMVFTFLKAKGLGVGTSLVEDDFVETAKEVMAKAEKLGKEIILPVDIVIADKFDKDADSKVVAADAIPDGWMGLDNGPETTALQKEALSDCKTVIMNGPMGVFEFEKFSKGTFGIVDILADLTKEKGAVTIIGGGDSVAATELSGRAGDMSHISTGGGASLELLEGKVLPGVAALNEK